MKRLEIRLSLPVVAPLLDAVREVAKELGGHLAVNLDFPEEDREFQENWSRELLQLQRAESAFFLNLFDHNFLETGTIEFDEDEAEKVIRACSAIRLHLREQSLGRLPETVLETGDIDLGELDVEERRAFTAYLFLATLQEIIIRHLDPRIGE